MKHKIAALILSAAALLLISACGQSANSETQPPSDAPPEITPISIEKSLAGNPIGGFDGDSALVYGGDPSALVVGDTLYLYVGHDVANGDSYVIPEYLCYSTKDMVDFTYEGVVLSMADVSWAERNSAWAGQVARHYDEELGKDMYYFYFCSWDSTDSGKQSIGVAVSESPTGPFVDMGEALVKGSFTTDHTSNWNDIDPTVWIEKDEAGEEHRYLAWGNSKLYICELNEDMVSVKDFDGDGSITFGKDIRSKMLPTSFTEAPWIYRRQDENGNYYGDYYVFYAYGWREQMAYATTGDLMTGKLIYGDVIMRPTATSNTNHMAVVDFLGKTYFIYHNGSLPGGSGYRRVACVEELKFYSDGAVAYLEETATGISGNYSTITSLNGDILAHEWFNNSSSDDVYPYTSMGVGSDLTRIKAEDTYWEIVPGKADTGNEYYVSIESYNKAGLYLTVSDSGILLAQDHNKTFAEAQTFRTVTGLGGEGVSFESVAQPGLYLTLSGGKATLTDGTDALSCTFTISAVTE